jgi:uncharacterized protein
MISDHEKQAILGVCEKYHVEKVLLFGSSQIPNVEANDIDLAVEGVADKDFFSFYADLMFAVEKPVDLIDLKRDSKFNRLIKQTGTVIYG